MEQGASEVALGVMGVGQIERCKVCLGKKNGLKKHLKTREKSLDLLGDYVVSGILSVLSQKSSEDIVRSMMGRGGRDGVGWR